ncbi:MAG: nucleoside recognition domain-containing protein [bacterium]
MADEKKINELPEPGIGGYISLVIAILIFSGIFAEATGALKVLDFTTLIGDFGTIEGLTFRGKGGVGARDGFLFALNLVPTVMAAIGIVNVVDKAGGLAAGAKLLTPILRPLMGIPGVAALALVGSLNSSDAGAAMTRDLTESGFITGDERDIFVSFQFPGSATITNYFASGAALFGIITVSVGLPFVIILILKLIGANIFRFLILPRIKSKGVSVNG